MQANLEVLEQYSLELHGTASKLIEVCLGARQWQKWRRVLSVLASDVLPYIWRRWGCGGLRWIRWLVAAPLVDYCIWTDFHMTCIIFVYCCVLLFTSFSLVASLRGVLPVK